MSFLETLPGELRDKIVNVIKQAPESIDAFNSLYFYLIQNQQEPETKKRKVSNNNVEQQPQSVTIDNETVILLLPKLSFQSPLRKKLNLVFALNKDTEKPVLAVTRDDDFNPEIALTELTNSNVIFAAFLPVVEKPKLQHLVIFYKQNLGGKYNNDPLILNFNQENLVQELVTKKLLSPVDKNYKNRIIRQASICGFKIEDPFVAQQGPISSFFVEAHKGTKEGVLYFLPNHILFGFKKPILLYDSKDIQSITYSSITRITFNITLLVRKADPQAESGFIEERIEFSMIDQSEFSKIDGYIKAKEVVDNSMAEELKAKPAMKHRSSETEGRNGGIEETSVGENLAGADSQLGAPPGDDEDDSDDEEADETYHIGDGEADDTSDVSDEYESNEDAGGDDDDDDDDEEE